MRKNSFRHDFVMPPSGREATGILASMNQTNRFRHFKKDKVHLFGQKTTLCLPPEGGGSRQRDGRSSYKTFSLYPHFKKLFVKVFDPPFFKKVARIQRRVALVVVRRRRNPRGALGVVGPQRLRQLFFPSVHALTNPGRDICGSRRKHSLFIPISKKLFVKFFGGVGTFFSKKVLTKSRSPGAAPPVTLPQAQPIRGRIFSACR